MPNWCENIITIKGDKKTIGLLTRIVSDKQNHEQIFESLIGEPDVLNPEFMNGKYFSSNSWWFGTKWDVSFNECNFDFTEECITLCPLTAWSPPVSFLVNLSKMYKVDCVNIYSEGGCDFCGRTIINNNGDTEVNDYSFLEGNYILLNDDFWECEVEHMIQYSFEEGLNVKDFIKQYTFLSKEDKKELKQMYVEFIKEESTVAESN